MQDNRWIAAAQLGDSLWVWVHDGADIAVSQAKVQNGMEATLIRLIEGHLQADQVMPVLCAGLDGGGYVPVPAAPPQDVIVLHSDDPRIALLGMRGLSQSRPADLMGAQVAQVAGFIAAFPEWDGVLCLTGLQSKWVHISAGEVVSFQTYLTGEIFDLLSKQSVLRDAVQGVGWDDAAFSEGVSDAMSRPERVAGAMFSLHAAAQLTGADPAVARAKLLGMLIGTEMAAARPYWLGQNVALIGDGASVTHYEQALRSQGVPVQCHDAGELTLRGLQQTHAAQAED